MRCFSITDLPAGVNSEVFPHSKTFRQYSDADVARACRLALRAVERAEARAARAAQRFCVQNFWMVAL
jgi:hypothetical protein